MWTILLAVAWAADPEPWPFGETEARGLLQVEPEPVVERPAFLLRNATVMTAAGAVFAPGYVWVVDGKIREVG